MHQLAVMIPSSTTTMPAMAPAPIVALGLVLALVAPTPPHTTSEVTVAGLVITVEAEQLVTCAQTVSEVAVAAPVWYVCPSMHEVTLAHIMSERSDAFETM